MKAIEAAARILTTEQIEKLQAAGISLIWESEKSFLLWAANCQEQQEDTYKKLDRLQKEERL